ncbi:hypothetical protein DRH13_05070 [Candidatus Woesebacteria bacterium]|nr:MAG: hypothetical protein DRH13_05070 [Candidatus Woesebacteria bacterium]
MKTKGFKSGISNPTKKIAKQAAKQMAREPLEILKTAGKQVSGAESTSGPIRETSQEKGVGLKDERPLLDEKKIKTKSKRLLTALEKEIEDIRKQKEFEEEENLKEEKNQKQILEEQEKKKTLPEISSKRVRGVARGMKGKLKKLKTKAEIRMPPSG